MLFLDDLQLLLQVADTILRLLQLASLLGQLGLQLFNLILLFLNNSTCCLVLRRQLLSLGLLLFLELEGNKLALLLHLLLLACYLFRLELRCDFLLLGIINHLFQSLLFRLGLLKEDSIIRYSTA